MVIVVPKSMSIFYGSSSSNGFRKLVHLAWNRLWILSNIPISKVSLLPVKRSINSSCRSRSDRFTSTNTKMSTSRPTLYSYFRSSASWRVRIVLAHKGIDFEYKAINLLQKEQLGDEYKKICPMAQVPALKYEGKIITQSMAIMEFLEDIYPEKPMMPKDVFAKAKVLEICDIVNSGIQPLQNLSVILKYSDDPEKRTEWANFWISKGLAALETVLSESSGKYCVGNELTLADACFFPQVASAGRFKVDIQTYPNINRIYNFLGELEAFKKAHAFAQSDCPDDLKIKGTLQ